MERGNVVFFFSVPSYIQEKKKEEDYSAMSTAMMCMTYTDNLFFLASKINVDCPICNTQANPEMNFCWLCAIHQNETCNNPEHGESFSFINCQESQCNGPAMAD
jgi:hypothetical protein